jgi:hypothetical protein
LRSSVDHPFRTMSVETVRKFKRASPFVPFEIRANGGERLRAPLPDFVLIAPRGGWVGITDEEDHVRHISSLLIEEVAPLRKRARRK